jgi:hypothetical protein
MFQFIVGVLIFLVVLFWPILFPLFVTFLSLITIMVYLTVTVFWPVLIVLALIWAIFWPEKIGNFGKYGE